MGVISFTLKKLQREKKKEEVQLTKDYDFVTIALSILHTERNEQTFAEESGIKAQTVVVVDQQRWLIGESLGIFSPFPYNFLGVHF